MNLEEYLKLLFSKEARDKFLNKKSSIMNMIQNCTNSFFIKTKNDFGLVDVAKKGQDSKYLSDYEVEVFSNGFNTLYLDEESWNDIRNKIPRSVKELRIPSYIMDSQFLKEFKLDKLIVDFAGKEELDFCKMVSKAKEIICYRNDTLYWTSNFDVNSFKLFFENYDFNNGNLDFCTNDFEIEFRKIDGKLRINIIMMSLDDVHLVKEIYYYIKNKGINIESINLDVSNINYLDLNYESLEEISSQEEIDFKYNIRQLNKGRFAAKYQDMKEYVAKINDIRKLLIKLDNPLTKYLVAFFSIVYGLKFAPDYSPDTDKFEYNRAPHFVLKYRIPVCEGISMLLVDICKDIDKNLDVRSIALPHHMRVILNINDEKFGYNGIYISEPTWAMGDKKNDYYFLCPYGTSRIVIDDKYEEDIPEDFKGNYNKLNPRFIPSDVRNKILYSNECLEVIYKIMHILNDDSYYKSKSDINNRSI